MLLATQCPHCFTSFRVANDQLKLHAGLVRCGACQQTFNGIEYLIAPGMKPAMPLATAAVAPRVIEADLAADPMAISAPPTDAFSPVQVAIPDIGHTAPDLASDLASDLKASFNSLENANIQSDVAAHIQPSESIDASVGSALEFDLGDEAFSPIENEAQLDVASDTQVNNRENIGTDLPTPTQLIDESEHRSTAPESQLEQTELEPAAKAWNAIVNIGDAEEREFEENPDEKKPDFVIQAEKKHRRSRVARVSMIILSTLLFFTLLAQGVYGLRNHVAAWFPQSKPVLQEACKFLSCRIELLTQIEVISIEANELQALSSDKNIFSLAIQLQNKSGTLQAWPMLELILNDAKDKPVLQRVFTPADYLSNKNDLVKGFGANSVQTVKLYFELSGPKAAGYHVGVFYP